MAENLHDIKSAQILVVEDEVEIRELISLLLLRQGHRVEQVGSAVEAWEKLKEHSYDLMVLDWMLPQMSGIDLLKMINEGGKKSPPVLMVTAKAEPVDIVHGLESGADDYVTKPFEPGVFSARVRALLRRAKQAEAGTDKDVIKAGELSVNLMTYEVKCSGQPLHLTPSEFKIISEMAINCGRVMTREHLVRVVQGEGISVTGRTIDTHVFGLRKKMGACSDNIETIRGVGYRMRGE
jgi:two-component system phosphate regulon response regulator PhoB